MVHSRHHIPEAARMQCCIRAIAQQKIVLRGCILAQCLLMLGACDHPPSSVQTGQTGASQVRSEYTIMLVDNGAFDSAERDLTVLLADPDITPSERAEWEFERERMRRIRLDFSLDRNAVMAKLRERIPDLSDTEFSAWTAQGLLENLRIDGETRYFKSAVGNLFRLSAEARARTQPPSVPETDPPLYAPHSLHAHLLHEASERGQSQVNEQHLRVRHRLTLKADAVPPGAEVRAWIPYPRAIAGRQENIRLLRSEPAAAKIAAEASLQRTAFLSRNAVAGQNTEFDIEYELTTYAHVQRIDPAAAQRPAADSVPAEFLVERAPHVVFSPALKHYSDSILAGETRPYYIAQKLFAAVDDIPWAVAREYSTLSNISDYAMTAGHADCGQKTLLLISLLRLNGIPARWQSGWQMSPTDFDTMHDWGEFYLEPYGWMPMDVTHGRLGGDDSAIDWFYLGSIDGFRVAFNDDYSREFDPPKKYPRSETVDSQRGEIEWDGGNLYFDQWDYHVEWEHLSRLQAPYNR
jgi:transglutaminase-like putative cysteine protease